MFKKGLLVLAIAAVAMGAYLGAERLLLISAQKMLAFVSSSLPAGTSLTYGNVTVSLLGRSVELTQVEFLQTESGRAQRLTADDLILRGVPWLWHGQVALGGASFTNIAVQGPVALKAAALEVLDPSLRQGIANEVIDLKTLAFSRLSAQMLELTPANSKRQLSTDRLELGRLSDGVLESIQMDNFRSGQGEGRSQTSVEHLSARHIDLAQLMPQSGTLNLLAPLTSNALEALDITDLVRTLPDGKSRLEIPQLGFATQADAAGNVIQANLKAATAAVPLGFLSPDMASYLAGLGYDTLQIKTQAHLSFDPQLRQLNIVVDQFAVDQAMDLAASFSLGGIDLRTLSANPVAAAPALLMTTLIGGQLILDDRGLVSRYVKQESDRLQVTPSVFIEQKINSLRPAGNTAGPGAQKIGRLYRAVAGFLMNPGILTVSAAPAQPVPLTQFFVGVSGPEELMEIANISAENRQH